jgi:serine/threonine-protein kinase
LIEINPPLCLLKDYGSTNGTRVNGVRVAGQIRLRDGDTIAAGTSVFMVHVEGTREQLAAIRCLVCRAPAPDDIPLAVEPEDPSVTWLCPQCVERKRNFPSPPEGYWIEERIGGGGMGEVYKARVLATGQYVAIKMMIPSAARGPRAEEYFRREMKVLEQLKHRHIVEFYGMDDDLGQYQLIMEYVEGENAQQWLERHEGRAPVDQVIQLGLQLLSALSYAHGKGFVHRDIKPSNLLVTETKRGPFAKLSDFGLAKNFRDDAGFTGLTHQGDVGGSIGFISPDHIRDFRIVKETADIYSTGATLYYMLTGQYPYLDFDPNRSDAYAMILEHPTVPLRVHRPDAPEELERVLRKSLEKQSRDRWRSAAAMAEALRSLTVKAD